MSKPFRAIAWTTERFENLKHATTEAVRLGQRHFTVDLDHKHKGASFNLEEAVETINALEDEFANNPMPTFPENREGAEP